MKKFLSVLLSLTLACGLFVLPVASQTDINLISRACLPIYMGDADKDYQITPADARIVLRSAVGLEILRDPLASFGDCDRDGKITPADARIVLRMAVGLENPYGSFCAVHGDMIDHICTQCGAVEEGYAFTVIRNWIHNNAIESVEDVAYADFVMNDETRTGFGVTFYTTAETVILSAGYGDSGSDFLYRLTFSLPEYENISYAYYEIYNQRDFSQPELTARAESYFYASTISQYYGFPFTAYEGAEDELELHFEYANSLLRLGVTGLLHQLAEDGINITLEDLGFPNLLTNEK